MRLLFTWLALASANPAFGCWACPEGQTCELADGPQLSKAELQKYVESNCSSTSSPIEHTVHLSTGLTVNISCSNGRGEAVQVAPNKVMRIAGEAVLENNEKNQNLALRTDCFSQQDCLNANTENLTQMSKGSFDAPLLPNIAGH